MPPSIPSFDSLLASLIEADEHAKDQPVDISVWTEKYPQYADQIRSFFSNRGKLEEVVGPRGAIDTEAPTIGFENKIGEAAVGQRIRYFGDYELLDEIARGGMGVVFKARQVSLNRVVALKMILAGNLAGPSDVQRFHAEAEAAANLDHPNIVPIYEVGDHEGQHYFSMKLIEGNSLSQAKSNRPKSETPKDLQKWAASLVAQVARAVHHAHQRSILHRDLKPGNILIDKDGEPHVTDFGLAKKVEGGSDLTNTGAIVGTPAYMAPEQARCEKGLSTAVDVYSLGAILYELLTGRPPFQGATPLDTILEVLEKEPARPSSINPGVDRDLETVALKCLEKEPEKRYGSAEALAEELERWCRGEPILARPVPWWERVRKWARRRPAIAALSAALLLLFVIGFVGMSFLYIRANDYADSAEREAREALVQKRDADVQRRLAEEREQMERRTSYANRIARAHRDWQTNQVSQAERILDECPSDLRSWEWNYLKRICHPEIREFVSQGNQTITEHVSTGGGRVAAILDQPSELTKKESGDWPVKKASIWNGNTGSLIREFCPKGKSIREAKLSPDGRLLAATHAVPSSPKRQPDVTIVDVDSGVELFTIPSKENVDYLNATFTSDSRRLVWLEHLSQPEKNQGGRIKVCDARTGREVDDLLAPISLNFVAFTISPDGQHIAFQSSEDPAVHLWDMTKKQQQYILNSANPIAGITFSTNSRQLATGHADGLIQLWDISTGKSFKQIQGHKDIVTTLAFTRDNSRLVSGSFDAQIKVWNTETGKEAMTIRGDGWAVDSIALDAADRWVTASGIGVPLRLWNLASNPEFEQYALNKPVKEGFILESIFSPDAHKVMLRYEDRVQMIDLDRVKPAFELTSMHFGFLRKAEIGPVRFQQDGTLLTSSLYRDSKKIVIHTRDAAYGREIRPRRDIDLSPMSTEKEFAGITLISHDAKKLIALSATAELAVWDIQEARLLMKPVKLSKVNGMLQSWLSPNDQYLVLSDQKSVVVFDLPAASETMTGLQVSVPFEHVLFSGDSRTMAVTHEKDNRVTFIDTQTGAAIRNISVPGKGVVDTILSPDGKRLFVMEYVTSSTALVRIFDTTSTQELCALPIQMPFQLSGLPFLRMLDDRLFLMWAGRENPGKEGNTGWIIWDGRVKTIDQGKPAEIKK